MKQYQLIIIGIILSIYVVPINSNSMANDKINALKRQLKDCDNAECKQNLQHEAESIFSKIGRNFTDDFSGISNQISVNHCHSLIREIFYHMDRLKVYYNYKDVFFMKKLKKLKENRDRLDLKKISSDDFQRLNNRVEAQYKKDIQESQDFIDDKVIRLIELCDNLNRNIESIQENLNVNGKQLKEGLTKKILDLQNNKIWQEFVSNEKECKKIESSIKLASNNAGDKLIPRLKSIFQGFNSSTGNTIFPVSLLKNLMKKYPIN